MRMFYTVNKYHVRDLDLDSEDILRVRAVRFWAVVDGFVMSTKSKRLAR